MRKRHQVMVLRVDFKVALEDIMERGIGAVYKAIGRWAKPGMHGKATISFLVVTNETSTELHRRLRPALEQMGSVENYWCYLAPEVAVANRGSDPFVHWLGAAWDKARQWNASEDVGKSKFFRNIPKRTV